MKKTIALLNQEFQSSSSLTPQFAAFFNVFKKEFANTLKKIGCIDFAFNRGHFYISGFFTAPSGQIYYFSLSDVRMLHFHPNEQSIMFRTATSYKDYTGGTNKYIKLSELHTIRL
jgi:hypothetical protein